MIFSSLTFLFAYLPLTLAVYFLAPLRWRNLVLLLVSLFFYGWGEPVYIVIMFASILIDYIHGLLVEKYRENDKKARWFVGQSVVFNLLLLGFFKYWDFLAANLSLLPGVQIPQFGIPLPIGISFFTFQTMSYTIDVYRQDAPVQRNIVDFGAFVTMFPQLIAGPIVKYKTVAEDLNHRVNTTEDFALGARRFCVGLAKKVLLANSIGALWDAQLASQSAGELTVIGGWLGLFAFGFQIYFDFSGYSDMAIGLGQIFGFRFNENFDYPYLSASVTEFWRRWHMSLTRWFREYLYFPLGGSRTRNADGMVRNLLIVWLCTGIWHGANWTFVFWGLWNFLFVVLERVAGIDQWPRAIWRHGYTLLTVLIGWVLFRSDDLYCFFEYMANLFCLNGNGVFSAEAFMLLRENWLWLAASVLACVSPEDRRRKLPGALYPAAMLALLGVCVLYLVRGGYNPFIYFNF